MSSVCLNYKQFVLIKASNLSMLLPHISCISVIYAGNKFDDKIVLLQSPCRTDSEIRCITHQVMTINTLSFLSNMIRCDGRIQLNVHEMVKDKNMGE